MSTFKEKKALWKTDLVRFHDLLVVYFGQKVDPSDPDWFVKGPMLPGPFSDVERGECCRVLFEIADHYLTSSTRRRKEIREFLADFPLFHGVFPYSNKAIKSAKDRDYFIRCLACISMTSMLRRDPRDTQSVLLDLCRAASKAKIKINPILKQIAEISDDHDDQWVFGSTQKLILSLRERPRKP